MIAFLLLSLALAFWLGLVVVLNSHINQGSLLSNLCLRLSLGAGMGLGVCSCLFFVWLVLFGVPSGGLIVCELALCIGLTIAFVLRRKLRPFEPAEAVAGKSRSSVSGLRGLSVAFCFFLILAFVAFLLLSLARPHGGMDAFQYWNLRARFMFRDWSHWRDAFSPLMYMADYPVLIPIAIARCWWFSGQETLLVPALIAFIFAAATLGMLVASLWVLGREKQALLAGFVLISTPSFVEQAAAQQADVPIGFFFLAAIVLFALHDSSQKDDNGYCFLAGITSGLAAWTKNEGLLFVCCIVFARLVVVVAVRGAKVFVNQLVPFLLGLAPVLMVLFYFKAQIAPDNPILTSQGSSSVAERLMDVSRYAVILRGFGRESLHFTNWMSGGALLAAFCLFVLNGGVDPAKKPVAWTGALVVFLLLAGYAVIYLITPFPIHWHLRTSLSRLLLQLWPMATFVLMLLVRIPQTEDSSVIRSA